MTRKPIPKDVRKQVYEKYNGRCPFCGQLLKGDNEDERKRNV